MTITEHVMLAVLRFLAAPWDGAVDITSLNSLICGNGFDILVFLPTGVCC